MWTVVVNNNAIDLAYVYVPMTDARWKNLAAHVGLKYDDVSEFLQNQSAPPVQPPPPPNPNNPPPANPNSNALEWMPVVEMDKQIFPSFFLATATQSFIESQVAGVIGDGNRKSRINA